MIDYASTTRYESAGTGVFGKFAWQTRDEATRAVACHLRYRRTGRNIQRAFISAINAAFRRNLLERDGPKLIWKRRAT